MTAVEPRHAPTKAKQTSDLFGKVAIAVQPAHNRFGPRLAHLNGVLQVLSQLSAVNGNAANAPQ